MNNPTVILNGDQVYCDELIRENARLTIQHEVDRQKMEALERQIEDQAANIASLEAHSYARGAGRPAAHGGQGHQGPALCHGRW